MNEMPVPFESYQGSLTQLHTLIDKQKVSEIQNKRGMRLLKKQNDNVIQQQKKVHKRNQAIVQNTNQVEQQDYKNDKLKSIIVQELIQNYACSQQEVVREVDELDPLPNDRILRIKKSNLIINKNTGQKKILSRNTPYAASQTVIDERSIEKRQFSEKSQKLLRSITPLFDRNSPKKKKIESNSRILVYGLVKYKK